MGQSLSTDENRKQKLLGVAKLLGEEGLGKRLSTLTVHRFQMLDEQLSELLEVTPNLGGVDLKSNLLGFASAKRLSQRPLRELSLCNNRVGAAGGKALLQGPHRSRLRVLDLSNNGLNASALTGATGLESLESLELGRNPLGLTGIEALTSLELPRLRHLGLRQTGLTDAGLARLVEWKPFAQLDTLDAADHELSERGAKRLASRR